MMCVYCCDKIENPEEYRAHMDGTHKTVDLPTAFAHTKCRSRDYLKVDCTNLKCRLCKEPFDTVAEIARHLKDRHDNKGIKDMDLNYEVGLHPFRLIKDKLYCLVCNMKQPTLTKLTRHMSSHFADYFCDVCDKSYLNVESLRFHVKYSHSEKYICRKCTTEFSTLEEKKEHLKASAKCWGFACIHCKERFSSWERKQQHLVNKHNLQALSYPCSDCGVVFNTRGSFYHHYNTTHSELARMCSYCGKKFKNKSSFETHLIIHTRTAEKDFQCNVCTKAFNSNKGLQDHMWTHRETKRYPCGVCDMAFCQKISLTSHMKRAHPDCSQ